MPVEYTRTSGMKSKTIPWNTLAAISKREERIAKRTPKSPEPIQNHDIVCMQECSDPREKAVEIVRVNYPGIM
jgi:hypothetical protein